MTALGEISAAKVETLAAAVRVLMVGSRQVTMSVYDQLDEVNQDEIVTFGRVRSKRSWPFATVDLIEVVGSADGQLVRSQARTTRYYCADHKASGRILVHGEEAYAGHCSEHPGSGPRDGREGDHLWGMSDGRYCEWETLPLIVLAGLR